MVDEVLGDCQLPVPHIIGDLPQAEIEKQARSVKYQITMPGSRWQRSCQASRFAAPSSKAYCAISPAAPSWKSLLAAGLVLDDDPVGAEPL